MGTQGSRGTGTQASGRDAAVPGQWDLVCEAKALRDVAQSIYMAGVLLGSILFGVLSDRYCGNWGNWGELG